jgi:hypothetical protein
MNADFGVCTSDCSDLVLVITAFFYNYKYKLDLLYTHPVLLYDSRRPEIVVDFRSNL